MARHNQPPAQMAALRYRALGWIPLPVAPHSKRPLIAWTELQERMPEANEVRGWYTMWPQAGVAVVTGMRSGLVVLDVDPAHGGSAALAALEETHGKLAETVEAMTGGGGRHLYFTHPGGDIRNRTGFAPGLDLRADGGIVVAPPSIHPSGKPYRWRQGHAPEEIALARLPVWLRDQEEGEARGLGHPLSYWRALAREGVEAGRRNTTIASFTGHLLWHGVDPEVVMELMLAWNRLRCDPPLLDDEVVRTVRSIQETHRRHSRDAGDREGADDEEVGETGRQPKDLQSP